MKSIKVQRKSRSWRRRVRTQLLEVFGDTCCWCNEKMEIPHEKGRPIDPEKLKDMATIEHYFAKAAGQPDVLMFLRLAHKRCNR